MRDLPWSADGTPRRRRVSDAESADLRLPHFVHLPNTKNGNERDVALSARALAIVGQLRALSLDSISCINEAQKDANFRKAVKRSGLVDLVFHDSWHEAAMRLARKLDLLDLARLGCWRDVRMLLEAYYNPTGEEMAARLNA